MHFQTNIIDQSSNFTIIQFLDKTKFVVKVLNLRFWFARKFIDSFIHICSNCTLIIPDTRILSSRCNVWMFGSLISASKVEFSPQPVLFSYICVQKSASISLSDKKVRFTQMLKCNKSASIKKYLLFLIRSIDQARIYGLLKCIQWF